MRIVIRVVNELLPSSPRVLPNSAQLLLLTLASVAQFH